MLIVVVCFSVHTKRLLCICLNRELRGGLVDTLYQPQPVSNTTTTAVLRSRIYVLVTPASPAPPPPLPLYFSIDKIAPWRLEQ